MQSSTHQLTAAAILQREMVTTTPDGTLRDALALMTENHVNRLAGYGQQ
jgi:CBS domain-containing protein